MSKHTLTLRSFLGRMVFSMVLLNMITGMNIVTKKEETKAMFPKRDAATVLANCKKELDQEKRITEELRRLIAVDEEGLEDCKKKLKDCKEWLKGLNKPQNERQLNQNILQKRANGLDIIDLKLKRCRKELVKQKLENDFLSELLESNSHKKLIREHVTCIRELKDCLQKHEDCRKGKL